MAEFESISPLHPILQEVANQTNPENFMEPYDAAKVKRAMELNREIYSINIRKPLQVLELIEESIQELGCEFPSELVYDYLLSMYKPTTNRAYFDKYNELCQKLYEVKDDISAMTALVEDLLQKEQQEREEAARDLQKRQAEAAKEKQKEQQQNQAEAFKMWFGVFMTLGIMIASVFLFFYITQIIDNRNVNNNYRAITITDSMDTKEIKGTPFVIDIPSCMRDRTNSRTQRSIFYSYSGIDLTIIISDGKNFMNEARESMLSRNSVFEISNIQCTDTSYSYTYSKASLSTGKLKGNCMYILKKVPMILDLFPQSWYSQRGNYIVIKYDGYGAENDVAQKIANSIRLSKNKKESDSIFTKKIRYADSSIGHYRCNMHEQIIKIKFPFSWNFYYTNDIVESAIVYTPQNDFFIEVNVRSIDGDINPFTNKMFREPIDDLKKNSATKITIAACNAMRNEMDTILYGQKFKYISYRILKNNGYSTYINKEPIFGNHTHLVENPLYEDESIAKVFATMNHTEYNPADNPRYIEQRDIIGYKNVSKKEKNENTYVTMLFCVTNQWYNSNRDMVNKIVSSLSFEDL